MNNKNRVYYITQSIPPGRVLTYSRIAQLANLSNPRVVGNFLHQNTNPFLVPCHRVVNNKGRIASNYAFGGATQQITRLRAERITIENGIVDLTTYLWRPPVHKRLLFWLIANIVSQSDKQNNRKSQSSIPRKCKLE